MKKSITADEINALPLYEFEGTFKVLTTAPEAIAAINELKSHSIVGFDTETRPTFKKGEFYHTSLLQLSSWDCTYLFRLNILPPLKELTDYLSDSKITKAGVAIQQDVNALNKLMPFKGEGFVDLSVEAKKQGFENIGLRHLTAMILGYRLSKAAKITNWDRKDLTEAQLIYAACDAQVGLKIYQKLFS